MKRARATHARISISRQLTHGVVLVASSTFSEFGPRSYSNLYVYEDNIEKDKVSMVTTPPMRLLCDSTNVPA